MTQFSVRLGKPWFSPAILGFIVTLAVVVSLVCSQAFAAKPKSKTPAKPKPAEPSTELAGPPLPADLNLASMRLKALDLLYELDLSVEQLKDLRAAAAEAGSTLPRAAAKGTEKFATALREFQGALLERKDGGQIDTLRNTIADLVDNDDVQLDDGVRITATARAKAANVLQQFKASQIAAYLAAHADEIGDPVEMMVDTADQVREIRSSPAAETDSASEKPAAIDKSSDTAGEIASLVLGASTDVGELVAGLDEAKAKALATGVAKWINSNSALKEDDFAAKRKALEEEARQMVGDVHPMRVLDNWLEHQVALLLSNPQLPNAIDAIVQFKQHAN